MALLPASLDYTDKDFDALVRRLQSLIRSAFPTWTDFNVANFGNILIELFAFVGDVLGTYQDNQALEAFIVRATQRKNMIALAKAIGYTPRGAAASKATEIFALAAPPTADVVFAKGSTVRTADVTEPVVFQLLADVTIPAGANPPIASGTVEHSENQEDVFTATGLPDQEVVLGAVPYLESSAVVIAGNGVFTQVDDLLSSTSTDRHYTVTVDQNNRATLRFGNAANGALPFGTGVVAYKTGGGAEGEVEPGAISKLDGGPWKDALGNIVQVVVTNPAKATGGTNRETVEQIRQNAPRALRALTRTVAREDYEIHALEVPGVARALMTTSNEDPAVPENTGILYIVPTGGGLPGQVLKDAAFIACTVTYPNTLTFSLLVYDVVYLDVDHQMTVYRRTGVTPAQAGAAIRTAVDRFYRISNDDGTPNESIDFGWNYKDGAGDPDGRIPLSDVFNVVRDLPQIRRMGDKTSDFLLNGVHRDLLIDPRQFPRLGSITIVDGDTGEFI